MGVAVEDPRPRSRGVAAAPVLMLTQIASLQVGSAVAKGAYASAGPTALAGMRLFFAAVVLWLLVRPRLRGITAAQWRAAVALGLVLAAMNLAYFQAISRLPIGVAATLELLGPLALSIALSRRIEHLVVALLALAGVLLLAAPGASLPAAGLLLGGAAAVCRAGYVVLNRRVGRLFPDWTGLTLALAVGACVLTPVTAVTDGDRMAAHPSVLFTGLLVALLSSLIPYSLDMTVLRRIDARAFGVLLALSPAVAAGIGFVLLHEELTGRQLGAAALIVLAGAWSVRRAARSAGPPT
ncbi:MULTISPECIES: EamA family transporter [unclassified Streptomyces]|uniref:EamA family transporter n=1 Tax=unclassified Streptomyces TaxID=2593676 RepID=UPI002E181DF1